MVSAGSYLLSALMLVVVGASIAFTAFRLRQRLMPSWDGAPARLVESVLAIALLIWLGELLGTFGLFYDWIFVVASALLAAAALRWMRIEHETGHASSGPARRGEASDDPRAAPPPSPLVEGSSWLPWLVTVGVVALVFAHWGLTTRDALDTGPLSS